MKKMKETPKRGFAALSVEARLELARRGGKAAQASGNAHRFSSEGAIEAGRKGGAGDQSEQGSHVYDWQKGWEGDACPSGVGGRFLSH